MTVSMKSQRYRTTPTLTFLIVAIAGLSSPAAEQWGMEEIVLRGPSGGNPYRDVSWSATFSQGEKHITVPGFWDGGVTYRVRFSLSWTFQFCWENHGRSFCWSG